MSYSHNLPLVPSSETTRVYFTVLSLIPAGDIRPMSEVTLIQRFHPVCLKAVTGKAALVSSPGLLPVLVKGSAINSQSSYPAPQQTVRKISMPCLDRRTLFFWRGGVKGDCC